MYKSIYLIVLLMLILPGCEQPADELSSVDAFENQSHAPARPPQVTGAMINQAGYTPATTAPDKFSSVDENHMQEAQYTLTSRIEVLIQDAAAMDRPGVFITEFTQDGQPIIPPEERYLAFQSGFRAGVIRGINAPVVSAYFPETLPSKIQQQHWQQGQSAGHAYGVYLLKDYLAEKYDYRFESK